MRVNPNSEPLGVTSVPSRAPVQRVGFGQDRLVLGSADQLTTALEQTPATRAEAVERAKQLVQDRSYPPEVLIRKLSVLLAGHLEPAEQGEPVDPSAQSEQ